MILTISSSKIQISVHAMMAHEGVATALVIQNFGTTGRTFGFMPRPLSAVPPVKEPASKRRKEGWLAPTAVQNALVKISLPPARNQAKIPWLFNLHLVNIANELL